MVNISPFHAYHYNTDKFSSLEPLVSKPYDVISDEEKKIYKINEWNITHLELPTSYDDAALKLNTWIKDRVLIKREKASIFVYKLTFTLNGDSIERLGLISLLELTEFSEKKTLPHEMTFPKCMDDRLNLLRATKANLSPVFMIYEGREAIRKTVSEVIKKDPLFAIKDDENFIHEIWEISEGDEIDALVNNFKEIKSILIADGHHRYKTALNYYKETGKNKNIMVYMVDMEDPGLKILPTHRLIDKSNNDKASSISEKLSDIFDIKSVSSASELFQELGANENGHVFGYYSYEDKFLFLKLKPEIDPVDLIGLDQSDEWKKLDVSLLHEVIIKDRLDINGKIQFAKNPKKAINQVNCGEEEATFILNPTKIKQVQEITKSGELMPHKSTYFYPKPLSGVLIWVHEI